MGLYDETTKGPLPERRGTAGEGQEAEGFLESEGTRVYHGVKGDISMRRTRKMDRNLNRPHLTERRGRFEHDIKAP